MLLPNDEKIGVLSVNQRKYRASLPGRMFFKKLNTLNRSPA